MQAQKVSYSGESGVSSFSLSQITSTTSPMGTLVNSGFTSKLTYYSSLPMVTTLIVSAKCLEFKTCKLILPASGEMMDAMYLESW